MGRLINIAFSIVLVLNACSNERKVTHNGIYNEDIDKQVDSSNLDCYIFIGVIEKESGNDTIQKRHCIERNAKIFIEGRTFIYQAILYDSKDSILSTSKIILKGSNTRFSESPLNQMKTKIIYERLPNDSILLSKHTGNQFQFRWYDSLELGVTENIEKIWMHPFRSNQFVATETAAFPEVRFPLEIDKKWIRAITTGSWGWGDWNNKTFVSNYTITSKKEFVFGGHKLLCWEVKAITDFENGNSTNCFLFNENYGFVLMNYHFYNGSKITFKLLEAL